MTALEYHEATKHHFNRFARSAGYLDWAKQPDPFRRFADAPVLSLPHEAVAATVPFDTLFDGALPRQPMTLVTVGELLRCSVGLSAWKQFQASRWALRVNPSSGNLHPTETYIVWNRRVCHYAPRDHVLEERCVFEGGGDVAAAGGRAPEQLLVGFSSIFWREAWKYGERAFRYCQHDMGHAIAALRMSAARLGWHVRLLAEWSDEEIAGLLGLDRGADFADAEREMPECLLLVTCGGDGDDGDAANAAIQHGERRNADFDDRTRLLESVRASAWRGRANRLSTGHVAWPVIDEVAAATEYRGGASDVPAMTPVARASSHPGVNARAILLQRRSAVAFDGRSSLPAHAFAGMLASLRAGGATGVLPWTPQVHLALFVHRVDGFAPGIYAFVRNLAVIDDWRRSLRPEFIWEPQRDAAGILGDGELHFLLPFDMTWPATRVSCDQDIAGDGFFSLAMLGHMGAVRQRGDWFYRRLFWEAGAIGQLLYLEAEAAGGRGTGIGCFYDDAVHELLGVGSQASGTSEGAYAAMTAEWQSLYHFAVGRPVEDTRLTTEPGYAPLD
jgi:SagB-type dehydrogenase family enzyme